MFSTFFVVLFVMFAVVNFAPSFLSSRLRGALFRVAYRLYCSESVGYRVLKHVVHQSTHIPHSDHRAGVRSLSMSSSSKIAEWKPKRYFPPTASAAEQLNARKDKKFYAANGPSLDIRNFHTLGVEHLKNECGLVVMPIPMFADNYSYAIISLQKEAVALVDPADADVALYAMRRLQVYTGLKLILTEVLTTHKHWDHAGGNGKLLSYAASKANADEPLVASDLIVVGSALDAPLACSRLVADKDTFTILRDSGAVTVCAAPGHTDGSVIFVVGGTTSFGNPSHEKLAVFTGDTIFGGGCGGPFETTSLKQIITTRQCFLGSDGNTVNIHPHTKEKIDDDRVLLYVGHEYTQRLVKAHLDCMRVTLKKVEEDIRDSVATYVNRLQDALDEVASLRYVSPELPGGSVKTACLPLCTVPSSLATEKAVNPFLTVARCDVEKSKTLNDNFNLEEFERLMYCSPRRCE